MFIEHGYAVTMEAIAARAGVTKRTLYAHYGDKLALFAAVLSRLSSGSALPPMTVPKDLPVKAALVHYGQLLFDYYLDPHIGHFLSLMETERRRLPDLDLKMRDEMFRAQVLPLKHYLDARPQGSLRPVDTLVAARMLVQTVINMVGEMYARGAFLSSSQQTEFLANIAEVMAGGLVAQVME